MTAKKSVRKNLAKIMHIEETTYLLRSPTNAKRLRKSIQQANKGKLIKHKLIEKK